MSNLKQFAGQTVIYGFGHILSRIVYYILISSFLTYLLGSNTFEFGAYEYFYVYASFFVILFSFRLDTALFRFGSEKDQLQKTYNTSLSMVLLSAILLLILGFGFSKFFASLTPFPEGTKYIKWFAIILSFDIISLIPFAKLRLQNKAKTFALCKIFNVFISSVLIIFFLVVMPRITFLQEIIPQLDMRIDYVFISNMIASGLLFFILFFYAGQFKFKIDKQLFNKIIYYIFPLVIVGVCYTFIQNFAIPLQEKFLTGSSDENLAQGGIYASSRRIAVLFAMFTTAFNYAAEPFFFNNSSKEDRASLYGPICRLFTLIGGVVILALYLGMDIVQYIVQQSYRESLFVIPILLLSYLMLGLYYNVSIWFKLSDKTWYGAVFSIIGVLITVLISVVFLPQVGYVASAWATFFSYLVMLVLTFYFGQKLYPIPYPVKKILINLGLIIMIILLANFIESKINGVPLYSIKCLLFFAYLTYVYIVEKERWMSIIGNRS